MCQVPPNKKKHQICLFVSVFASGEWLRLCVMLNNSTIASELFLTPWGTVTRRGSTWFHAMLVIHFKNPIPDSIQLLCLVLTRKAEYAYCLSCCGCSSRWWCNQLQCFYGKGLLKTRKENIIQEGFSADETMTTHNTTSAKLDVG